MVVHRDYCMITGSHIDFVVSNNWNSVCKPQWGPQKLKSFFCM